MVDGYLGTHNRGANPPPFTSPTTPKRWMGAARRTHAGRHLCSGSRTAKAHPKNAQADGKTAVVSVAQPPHPLVGNSANVSTRSRNPGNKRAEVLRRSGPSEQVHRNGESMLLSSLYSTQTPILELLSHVDDGMNHHEEVPWFHPSPTPRACASIDAQYGEQLVRRMFARA